MTQLLLAAGADPNDAGPNHTVGEALYHACEHRDPTCARLLIEAGTDPEVVAYCLGRALNFDNHPMIAMFCSHGVRPWAAHLHQALWRRRPVETIAVLLDAGAPLEEPDEHGLTPLQILLHWGDGPVPALLRDHGASDVNELPDRSAAAPELLDEMMILTLQRGDLAAVRELLAAGARVDGNPTSEENPLGQACWRGRVSIVRELLAHGAGTEFRDGGMRDWCRAARLAPLPGPRGRTDNGDGDRDQPRAVRRDRAGAARGRRPSNRAGWWRTRSARGDAARRTRHKSRGTSRVPLTSNSLEAPTPGHTRVRCGARISPRRALPWNARRARLSRASHRVSHHGVAASPEVRALQGTRWGAGDSRVVIAAGERAGEGRFARQLPVARTATSPTTLWPGDRLTGGEHRVGNEGRLAARGQRCAYR